EDSVNERVSSHERVARGCKVLQLAAIADTLERFVVPLADALQKDGYEIHFACSPGGRPLEDAGFPVHRVGIPRSLAPIRLLRSLLALRRLMREERFDIVHVHTPVASALGRVAAKLSGVPLILYTVHGFYFHERMARWKRCILVAAERFLGRRCTSKLLCVSGEDAGTAVRERIARPEDVVDLHSVGVDTDRFEPHDAIADERLRRWSALGVANLEAGGGAKIIGFVGRLVREKGLLDLIQAMKHVTSEHPQAHLVVVGGEDRTGRDRETPRIARDLIARENLGDSIRFLGVRDDVPELLPLLDVFVLPSYREGMPRSILEAMACGVPVVATDIRGCREEVVDSETGRLVPPGDVQALSQAIRELLDHPERARWMGAAGRRRVEQAFDERDVIARHVAWYAEWTQGMVRRCGS
nr:glycosyltransferase family 4 protein [Candidatus Bipolaricaulota bacterium]